MKMEGRTFRDQGALRLAVAAKLPNEVKTIIEIQ